MLSNGTNFNDLEWPLTPISRSRYYSTSNNSQTVQDSYNGGLIESHTWSMKPRHFQWSWTNPNSHFFDTEYLRNGYRYGHSYYERRIGTRMWSIKWCHFQWPWTNHNHNPVFKVTPLFHAKYLRNGYRYGHRYYRRRIGNRTQAFEWHQFQWSWVTSKPYFKVTVLLHVK